MTSINFEVVFMIFENGVFWIEEMAAGIDGHTILA
jgi:hypothetical protein